jgi:hypothetical protein
MDIEKNAMEIVELAKSVGWLVKEMKIACTGSVYLDAVRTEGNENEWIVIRVADHKQVYHRWMTTYSVSPGDLWFEDLEEILKGPFGTVGDIL